MHSVTNVREPKPISIQDVQEADPPAENVLPTTEPLEPSEQLAHTDNATLGSGEKAPEQEALRDAEKEQQREEQWRLHILEGERETRRLIALEQGELEDNAMPDVAEQDYQSLAKAYLFDTAIQLNMPVDHSSLTAHLKETGCKIKYCW